MSLREILASCFTIDYEFSPEIKFSLAPQNFDIRKFYPHNEEAQIVTIELENGERSMDKCLFKFLYHVSDDRFSTAGGVSSQEHGICSPEKFVIPFTAKQFDEYHLVLTSVNSISGLRKANPDCFLSYFLITHFLVPRKDVLYGVDLIPDNFLDRLELDLDLLPKEVAFKILSKSNIWKKTSDQRVVKMILINLEEVLQKFSERKILKFLVNSITTIRHLGFDHVEILKIAINSLYGGNTEPVVYESDESDYESDE